MTRLPDLRSASASLAMVVATTRSYSAGDRIVHNLAFSAPVVLRVAGRAEARLDRAPDPCYGQAPLLVTSLARGGTTALPGAQHAVPGIATHLYRDMAFLTAPVLWDRRPGGKRRRVTRHQRANGDGLEIDLDTPEVLVEVLWQIHWPGKYGDSYCSKNNANIARLPFLAQAFPDARVVVPLRRSLAHATSLLRQHRNFLDQHARDPFVRRYIRDIGDFEFGRIHKPPRFPGMDEPGRDPATPDYWLGYWIAAFRHVADFDGTCEIVL